MNSIQREIHNVITQPDLFDGTLYSGFDVFETRESVDIPHESTIRSDRRLGHRAEDLMALWLECNPRYDIMARNLQLFEGKQTVGELDFILHDKQLNEVVHVELVCKFYVYVPELHVETDSTAAWWGPKFQDSLALKLQKLREKQFPLAYSSLANAALQPLLTQSQLTELPFRQKLCFKAFLFVPHDTRLAPTDIPLDCIVGTYVAESDWQDLNVEECELLPKLTWLEKIR